MRLSHLKALLDKDLVTESQHTHLEALTTRKFFSVYYELRIILYLGVLLFTTGIGILIYENIGELGHLLSIVALFILTIVCFGYAFKFGQPYSDDTVKPPTPFYDYVVLLGCLLFISVIGYLQFMYNLFDEGMGTTTLVTGLYFFYVAYRFDHLGVLSLAITALASFWSITISPQKWYSGDYLEGDHLYNTAIIFGAALAAFGFVLDKKSIKQHFTFTYMNISSLVYLIGALSGLFINDNLFLLYLFLLYAGCALTVYFAHLRKSFLFLLYAFVFGYIGTTYLLVETILSNPEFWFAYLMASCGGFIYFIIRYKNYFTREA
jgi:hypothetical protein